MSNHAPSMQRQAGQAKGFDMSSSTPGGRLSTHVLDTAAGKPAAGVKITLKAIGDNGESRTLSQHVTNADGRCDAPISPRQRRPRVWLVERLVTDRERRSRVA